MTSSPPGLERTLVVNADDFGISPGVNRGIVDAHRRGAVTAASLMANLPSAEDALERAAECPNLDLGLHLTLTAGRPLTPPEDVPTLVDSAGRFHLLGALLARLSLGRLRPDEIARELDAQVAWARARGVQPSHLDSHHHIHTHPAVARIVLQLAARHGIPYVRCPSEGLDPGHLAGTHPRDAARSLVVSAPGSLLRRSVRRRGLRTTRHFRGLALGFGFGDAALVRTLRRLPPGVTELMTHPGYPDAELARLTAFAAGRQHELRALVSPEAKSTLERRNIRLQSFRELARARSYT
jgi:chitin disaccharide deacetylase